MCLLWLELMCWPLTGRGGHTATTKETERPPPPGGPAGAMRRNARERRRGCLRRAGMIDAAHRWKARATAGCAQAPDLKPQAGPRSPIAKHDRADSTDEVGKSSTEINETKPIRQDGKGLTSRLRDGLTLDAVVSQQVAMHPARWLLNVVERRTALEAEGNCHVIRGVKSLRCSTC